jgi:hypothetical protein
MVLALLKRSFNGFINHGNEAKLRHLSELKDIL